MAAVSAEASLTEARAKLELMSRRLEDAQRRLDASEGLEKDMKRLGQEAVDMHEKAEYKLKEKQVT